MGRKKMKAIGIDIGGTNTAVSICSSSGKTLSRFAFPTPLSPKPERTIAGILKKIGEKCALDEIGAAGIGVPAMIKSENGFVFYAPNLGWKNFSVKKAVLKKHRFKKLIFENDASCAAWGIYKKYKGVKPHFLAVLTLGTGIGAGFVTDGKLFSHKDISVFEAGHIKVAPGGLRCGCGAKGCLEAYCGSAYMNNWASEFWSKTRFAGENLSAREIYDESRKGADRAKAPRGQKKYGSGMAFISVRPFQILLICSRQIKLFLQAGLPGRIRNLKKGSNARWMRIFFPRTENPFQRGPGRRIIISERMEPRGWRCFDNA